MKDYTEFRRTIDKTLEEGAVRDAVRDTAIGVGRLLFIKKAEKAQTSGEKAEAEAEAKEREDQKSGTVDELRSRDLQNGGFKYRYRARWNDEFRYFAKSYDAADWIHYKKNQKKFDKQNRQKEGRRQADERRRAAETDKAKYRRSPVRYNPRNDIYEPTTRKELKAQRRKEQGE